MIFPSAERSIEIDENYENLIRENCLAITHEKMIVKFLIA